MTKSYIKINFILHLTWLLPTVLAQVWHQFGPYEYLIGKESVNDYTGGNRRCLSFGARLAVVDSQEKQQFLEQAIGVIPDSPFGYYIGLIRLGDNFMWADKTPFSYNNWASGQPDNFRQEEYCATIGNVLFLSSNRFMWRDVSCSIEGRYICQRKIAPITRPNTQKSISVTFVETTTGQVSEVIATNATKTEEMDAADRLKTIIIPTVVVASCLLVFLVIWIVWKRTRRFKKEKAPSFTVPPASQTNMITNSLYDEIDARNFSQSVDQPMYDDVPEQDTDNSVYLTPIHHKIDSDDAKAATANRQSHYVDSPCFKSEDTIYANIPLSSGHGSQTGYLPEEHYDLLDKTR